MRGGAACLEGPREVKSVLTWQIAHLGASQVLCNMHGETQGQGGTACTRLWTCVYSM